MGKETKISVSVIGVLVAISAALLYARLTRDPRLPIEMSVKSSSGAEANVVPRAPTIERRHSYQTNRPISPAPIRNVERPAIGGASYLPDTDGTPVSDSLRQLTIPNIERDSTLVRPPTGYRSPAVSPAAKVSKQLENAARK